MANPSWPLKSNEEGNYMATQQRVGVIGATGYTGSEMVRLLRYHPHVSIEAITSESRAGERFSDVHPQFRGIVDQTLVTLEEAMKLDLDIVFLALPHGVSMDFVASQGYERFRVIDLSGDFRLDAPEVYAQWYGKDHEVPAALDDAVYGLPELNRDRIRSARLVANPGCYPTSAILPLLPLVRSGVIQTSGIVIDSKSGVTGAGAKAKQNTHYPNVNDNFFAYALKRHRHTPEIQLALSSAGNGTVELLFTPHLLPIDRGILSTTYSRPAESVTSESVVSVLEEFYRDEPFVRVVDEPPSVKNVRGSNYCDIFATYDDRTGTIITISVVDNLVKGAAGQAIHNMNIICGYEERTGLELVPLSP